jgi:hypothetical protein
MSVWARLLGRVNKSVFEEIVSGADGNSRAAVSQGAETPPVSLARRSRRW